MNSNAILKSAVTTALAAAAIAVTPAQAATDPGAISADNVLRVGGATATDRSLLRGWVTELCDAAATPNSSVATVGFNVEVFTTATNVFNLTADTFDGTRNYAVSCRMAGTAAAPANGQDTVLVKFSGGSSTGVTPVANGTAQAPAGSANWVDFAGCRDANGNPTGGATRTEVAAANGLPNLVVYTSWPTAGSQIPKAGLSDLEPALIVGGGGGLPLSTLAGASVPFGVAVTRNLFQALQVAQGLPGTCTGCVNSYTPDCTPNISSAVVAGIYKGNILSTTQLEDATGTALPSAGGVNGTSLRICRRGDGSGTQRSHQ